MVSAPSQPPVTIKVGGYWGCGSQISEAVGAASACVLSSGLISQSTKLVEKEVVGM